jgi:hypothetical protein
MYLTHNGIVSNDRELFAAIERERYGDVDSEAIAAVLSHAGTLAESPATIAALESVGGSAAIAAMDDRDGTVLLARISGSPLCILETRRLIIWASTAEAIRMAHTAAIGSLGRATIETVGEGVAIVIRGGRAERFTFAPLPVPVHKWVATPSTTGSYTPKSVGPRTRAFAAYSERWEWDDDDVLTVPETPKRAVAEPWQCELCGEPMYDVYDLFDGADDWELCGSCYTAATVDEPRALGANR